ncbi:MAG TPA: sigma-70 family RNA polymerase sigma factor [Candidatus Polarisedimenticolaceae bacterium]|nr:sigma-70 family RNA polymerase sigma factor [Candidatus Polarisedimenticolaceae bacterium]
MEEVVLQDRDDYALMRSISAGDAAALGALYDRHAATVLALAERIVKDRMDAEELLGDVFLQVWHHAERYDASRATPLGYLLTLARSRALDRLRARGRRGRLVVAPRHPEGPDREPPGGGSSPLEDALRAEQRRRLERALEELTPEQRAAVELAYFDGLSHSEIAEELSQPIGTVKSRIRLGLVRLRAALRVQYGAGDMA